MLFSSLFPPRFPPTPPPPFVSIRPCAARSSFGFVFPRCLLSVDAPKSRQAFRPSPLPFFQRKLALQQQRFFGFLPPFFLPSPLLLAWEKALHCLETSVFSLLLFPSNTARWRRQRPVNDDFKTALRPALTFPYTGFFLSFLCARSGVCFSFVHARAADFFSPLASCLNHCLTRPTFRPSAFFPLYREFYRRWYDLFPPPPPLSPKWLCRNTLDAWLRLAPFSEIFGAPRPFFVLFFFLRLRSAFGHGEPLGANLALLPSSAK